MKQAAIRLVAIDVDGTLLDSSNRLQKPVGQALDELNARGVNVVLATARSPQALLIVLGELTFAPLLVCFSGAWIGEMTLQSLTPRPALWEKRHTASSARLIVETAFAHDVEPNVFGPETWRVRRLTKEILAESQITDTRPVITSEVLWEGEEPNKILLITSEGYAAARLDTIAQKVRSVSTATFSKPNYLEIIPFGVNKAKALANLTRMRGLELSQVAALGDGLNDMEMLREAAIGIAMGNASDEVKFAADWVTGTNDEAGVAQAVRKLISEGMV
jgi:Cof subfamily protein (haloacid dehalogenase superfamily)